MDNKKIPLTDIELFCLKLHQHLPFHVIISVNFDGNFDLGSLEKAVKIVKDRHPYLNYNIEFEDSVPYFNYYPDVPIKISFFSGNYETWISLCENEMNNPIDVSIAPLFRISLLNRGSNNYDLIINISHIISDGICVLNFVKDIIFVLNKSLNNEIIGLKPFNLLRPSLNLYPDITKGNTSIVIDKWYSSGFILNTINNSSNSLQNNNTISLPKELRRSKLINYIFSGKETVNIIQKCKNKNLSVNSLLATALIFSLRDYCYKNGHGFSRIKSNSGINIRDCLRDIKIPARQFGAWAGYGYIYADLYETADPANFAISYGKILSDSIKNSVPFYTIKNLADNSLMKSFNEYAPKHTENLPYAILTNLGKITMDEKEGKQNKIRVNYYNFMTPMHRNWNNDLGFGVCSSSFNNELNLNFIYMEPFWTKNKAYKFISEFLYYIYFICC